MKEITGIILSILPITQSFGPITLEQSYPDNNGLSIIKLENSGSKYLQYDLVAKTVKLYNLHLTIFKTILLPDMAPAGNNVTIRHISENLFNTDNQIEILCSGNGWEPTTKENISDFGKFVVNR